MLNEREFGKPGDLIGLEETKTVATRCVIMPHLVDIQEKTVYIDGLKKLPVISFKGRSINESWFDVIEIKVKPDRSISVPLEYKNCVIFKPTGELFMRINEN